MFMNVDTKLMSNSYMHKEHTCIYVVAYVWIIFRDGPDSEGKWGLCESIEPVGGGVQDLKTVKHMIKKSSFGFIAYPSLYPKCLTGLFSMLQIRLFLKFLF